MGKTDYNQELTLLEINDFKKDGVTGADFLLNDLRLWDYTRWAHKSYDVIQKEIVPLRDNLISYDIEINKLHEKLKKDSISVKNDLTKLVDKILFSQLTKFDPNPMPTAIFNMKIAELEYFSDLISDKPLRDSSNVAVRITAIQSEIKSVKKLDSISGLLVKRDFDKEALDYKHFITNAYGTPAVLRSLIKATHEFAQREVISKEKEWEENMQALKWVFAEKDSIPLFIDDSDKRIYKPFVIANDQYTLGLKYVDSLAVGYFYTITPSRIPDIALNFPVDGQHFKKRSLPILKALSLQDANQVYFALFYSESKVAEGFPATLTRVNRSGGLAWSNNYTFELKPSELLFSSSTGELTIKTSSINGESKIVVIDKLGKKLQ
jgi:hypothetical protein